MEFMLVFHPLHHGKSYAFPCSPQGVVEVDGLSEIAKRNFDLAWELVGRDFRSPVVVPSGSGGALC